MDLIERMHRGLSRRYPAERFEAGDGRIRYLPSTDDGFEVRFEISDDDFLVEFDAWHDHFDDQEEALDWFVLGLSEDCRLKITDKGGRPYRWTVETLLPDGQFAKASIMGAFPLAFWHRSTIEIRQNHLPVHQCRS